MLELVDFADGSPFLIGALIAGNTLVMLGLILFACLLMDKLDARFGVRGFCGALTGIGMFGGVGGFAGWKIDQRPGAYIGAIASLAAGIAVVYLVLKLVEGWKRDNDQLGGPQAIN